MRKLEGKNAVVTGCNRGIGEAILEEFVRAGANVWALTRTYDKALNEKWASLSREHHVWIEHVPFDLAEDISVKEAIQSILKEKRPVDILVNNAGVAHSGLLSMTKMDDIRRIMDQNFIKPMMLMQGIAKNMIRNHSGCMINISSIGGIETYKGILAYGSSKAALAWATQSLSKEYGAYGIRVNAVAPGLVETQLGIEMHSEKQIEETIRLSTMRRMGKPSEIAKTVLFLASEDASFITGQIIRVDGGR